MSTTIHEDLAESGEGCTNPTIQYLRLQQKYLAARREAAKAKIEAAAPGMLTELDTISLEEWEWMQAWNQAVIAHYRDLIPQGKPRKRYTRRTRP